MAARTGDYDSHRVQVLVVDDDTPFRRLLCLVLEDEGYSVAEAPNGAVALERLRASPTGWVVVLNHQMPHLDGPGVIQAVMADPQLYGRHAFLYTSAGDRYLPPPLRRQLEELRAPYLRKPFGLEEFLTAVAQAAGRVNNFVRSM